MRQEPITKAMKLACLLVFCVIIIAEEVAIQDVTQRNTEPSGVKPEGKGRLWNLLTEPIVGVI
jgi:hypothetical protein